MTGTAASTTPGVDHLVAKEGHADLMGWAGLNPYYHFIYSFLEEILSLIIGSSKGG